MYNPEPRAFLFLSLTAITFAALVLVGCDADDDVQSYRTKKEPPPPVKAPSHAEATAPISTGPMEWDLPKGWLRKANPNEMRFATLSAGERDDQIEVAISQLGGSGGGNRANIDRWRNQIGLGPATDAELREQITLIENTTAQGLMVDLVGPAPEDGGEDGGAPALRMLAAIFPAPTKTWFIKTTGPAPVMAKHRDDFEALCRSVRFSGRPPTQTPHGAGAATPARQQDQPTWDLPAGWVQDKQARPMSVASFTIVKKSAEATVTITPLPGPPKLLGNINRWRGQVGLGELKSLDDEPPQSIEVAGQSGSLVDLAGPDKHMIGVIATRGGDTWFYKMVGPNPLVAEQKAAFEGFVRSIRFGEETGK